MDYRNTPLNPGPRTPGPNNACYPISKDVTTVPDTAPPSSTPKIPPPTLPNQHPIGANPHLKRFQQDLLVLTSLNDNSTLHWRPTWFAQSPFNTRFWTLHNPPNVVTERLPTTEYSTAHRRDKQYYTRRMRRDGDAPALYIKTWEHWGRYCEMYGVPYDFLCEGQVELLRMGLLRDERGRVCAPSVYPSYPEPQPLGQGRYILDPETYDTHLPAKFRSVDHGAKALEDVEAVVVHSDGALRVERIGDMVEHSSQWTQFDSTGQYRNDTFYYVDCWAPKQQGPGRRWSYLPWTNEQEESCKPPKLVVKLRLKGRESGRGNGVEEETPNVERKSDKILEQLEADLEASLE